MPRVSPDLLAEVVGPRGRLIVLSNRGPLTFDFDPDAPGGVTAARGSGGLVTALGDLGRHAPVTWVSAARSAADALVAPILPLVPTRSGAAGMTGNAGLPASDPQEARPIAVGPGPVPIEGSHPTAAQPTGIVPARSVWGAWNRGQSPRDNDNGHTGNGHTSNGHTSNGHRGGDDVNGHNGHSACSGHNGSGHNGNGRRAAAVASRPTAISSAPSDDGPLLERPGATLRREATSTGRTRTLAAPPREPWQLALDDDPAIALESAGPDEADLEPTDRIRLAVSGRRGAGLDAIDLDLPGRSPLHLADAPSPGPTADPRIAARVAALVAAQLPGQDIDLRFEVLPEEVRRGHYEVIANPLLWFLQHQMYALPYEPTVDADVVAAWRSGYRPANRRLADAAVDAAAGSERPTFLIQDYHLYLAAERIRERRPDATILHFTHIPWPSVSVWQTLPQGMRRAICEGLLAADIVGLQTDRYATNFIECVESFVHDARIDGESRTIRWHGRRIRVGTYPISLDPESLARFARSHAVESRVERLRARLARAGNPRVIVRADRIEPSKNALRGFLAFEDLLRRRPELRRGVRFIAVQAPTRTALPEYAEYARAVREVVARINGMADPDEQPIWIYDGSDYAMAIAALRLADTVLVNPVVDGMNLVAKEAVLVGELDPVLVLSETAGAAEQLARQSLAVAPADIVGTSEALERALTMPRTERHERARRLRQSVRSEDIGWWLNRQLRDLAAVRRDERPPSRRLRDAVRSVETPLE